jgi:hypothetical protein
MENRGYSPRLWRRLRYKTIYYLIDNESVIPVEKMKKWNPDRLFIFLGILFKYLYSALVILKKTPK